MSQAVICDECGQLYPESRAIHCADAKTSNGFVYGADICKKCSVKFDFVSDVYGWHVTLKESKESEVK